MVWTADAFLKKRYLAGYRVGIVEGLQDAGNHQRAAAMQRFLDKNPDATRKQIERFMDTQLRDVPRG